MTPRYRHPTIEEKGLKTHIEEEKDKGNTNGYGYDDFVHFMSPDNGFRPTDIVHKFGKSWPTIRNWIRIYKEENK